MGLTPMRAPILRSMTSPWPDEPTIEFSKEFEPFVTLHLPREPVSQGASGKKRRGLIADVQGLTRDVPWMFTGDVTVRIEWLLHPRWKYESDRALDVDNILKPIIDGLRGPDGVLIDDTQLNHVSVNWMDWTRTDRQHLRIDVRSIDPWLYSDKGFQLVEVRAGLCLPLPDLPDKPDARAAAWRMVANGFDGFDELERLGATWENADLIRPIQRVFRTNKVTDFPLISPEQYVAGNS